MSKPIRISLIGFTLLAGLILAWGVVSAAPSMINSSIAPAGTPQSTPTLLPQKPEIAAVSPDVSVIDSPTPSCFLPRMNTGECYLTWYYMYADASPSYMISMTVSIDDVPRARYNGFFQTSMYVPTELMNFKVHCGAPGSGGNPDMGASHTYTLRARDSGGLTSQNSGTLLCPADLGRTFLPVVRR